MIDLRFGDCLTFTDLQADAVITDPPYGIKHKRGKSGDRGKRAITLGADNLDWDNEPFDPSPWLGYPIVVLWGANWYSNKLPAGRWLVWDKKCHGGSGDFSEIEVAWCNRGKALKVFRHMWMGVQRASEVGQKRLHPTQKPVALMEWVLDTAGVPKDATVLDPYMGSGTTGVACINTGRNFIGIEKDPQYFETAKRRIEQAQNAPKQAQMTYSGEAEPNMEYKSGL